MAVVAEDPQKQLEWEARQRPRAGIAAIVAVVTMLGGLIGTVQLSKDVPNPSGIETFQRALEPGPVAQLPSLQLPALQYLVDHSAAWLLLGALGGIGAIAGGWSMGFLAVATRARRPELRRWVVYLPIVGGVLAGLAFFLREVAQLMHAHDVLDGARTVAQATDISGPLIFASALGFFGQLATAGGYVLVSLHAMRAGLLTRLLGTLGIGAGVFTILPILPFGPLLQLLLQAALALLFFRFWMGGIPPAWESGKAEPWPSRQMQVRAAPEPAPAPQPAGPGPTAAARRGKRKKRH